MTKNSRVLISMGCFALLSALAFYMAKSGTYGWTLFVMLPIIAGGLSTWTFRPATAGSAVRIGVITGACECSLFLLTGFEGFICVLMALPILLPLTIFGSLLAYWGRALSNHNPPAAMGLLLPLSLFFDLTAKPPVYPVTTRMVMNATPERIWNYVIAFPDISAQPDWVLSTGVAYPIRTRIEGNGVGMQRNCDLSTGTMQERVVVWDKPRLLRFVVTTTPPAMKERGLYGPIYPKHLDGYYIGKQGQFALRTVPGGGTLVIATSWYQHGLWPAEYWRWWSDLVVHHVHQRVLNHIRTLSESSSEPTRPSAAE